MWLKNKQKEMKVELKNKFKIQIKNQLLICFQKNFYLKKLYMN